MAAPSVPSPVMEGQLSVRVDQSTGTDTLEAAGPDHTTASRGVKGTRRSSGETEARSESGRGDGSEAHHTVLQEAGLAIDSEVADPDARDDELLAQDGALSWIRRNGNMWKLLLNLLSGVVILAGVVLATPVSPEQIYIFRVPVFFGALIPIFFLTKLLTHSMYHLIEVHYFKEQLFHFSSMKKSTHHLLFFALLLVWYFLVFELFWCRHGLYDGACQKPAYIEATRIMMRVILCCTLATLASFLAALAAKCISTHFLKSTHFKKLHLALEKEHYLKRLSNPKLRRRQEPTFHKSSRVASVQNLKDQTAKEAKAQGISPGRLSLDTHVSGISTMWNSRWPGNRRHRSYDDADAIYLGTRTESKPHAGISKAGSYDDLTSIPKMDLGAVSTRSTLADSSTSNDAGSSGPPSPSAGTKNMLFGTDQADDVELTIGQNILNGNNLEMLAEERDVETMTEEEVDRLRTAVVIKTSSAMMRQHKFRTKEEKEQQLKNTKAFGKVLFYTIRGRDGRRPFFTYQDVKLFFPDTVEGKREARTAFSLFALDRKSKVTAEQATDAVLAIHKDRSNISASLNNTQSMIKSLQSCLAAGLHFLFLAFYLLIWRIDILAGFSAFSATVVALSFIFGNTICNLFESMLFLFVQHPYDIGDWVEFDGKSYEVVKISLMNTVFYASGMIRTVVPNATLIPKEIRNMSRLDTHLEIMTIQVDFGMVEVVKDEVRHRLQELTTQFSNDYLPAPLWVVYTGVEAANMKANLLVLWTYACAPADWERKHPARDRAVQLVTSIVAKHHSNGATYSYNHRITAGIPAEVMTAISSAGAAHGTAGNAARGPRAHRLKYSSDAA